MVKQMIFRFRPAGLLIAVLALFFMGSCSSSKYLSSNVKSEEISDLLRFETVSYVSLIEKGNQAYYSDSVSALSKALLDKTLFSYRNHIPFSPDKVVLTDSSDKKKLEEEILFLISSAEKNKNLQTLQLPPMIDSLLAANQKRFGLLVFINGFSREKGNYGKQIAKGAGLGLLTFGMYYQVPIKSSSSVCMMIVDGQQKNVAFYKKDVIVDDPTNQEISKKHVLSIFDGYFWNKK